MNRLILLVGSSASGKTSLAKELAATINCNAISLSEILRKQAAKKGFSSLHDFFAAVGVENAFAEIRVTCFNLIKLNLDKGTVVVDGVYDSKLFNSLKKSFEKELFVINVAASRHIRKRRMILRKKIGEKQAVLRLRKSDAIKKTIGLFESIKYRDFTVRNSGNLNKSLELIKQRIAKLK